MCSSSSSSKCLSSNQALELSFNRNSRRKHRHHLPQTPLFTSNFRHIRPRHLLRRLSQQPRPSNSNNRLLRRRRSPSSRPRSGLRTLP